MWNFPKKFKARKDKLTDNLAKNEKISDDDEHWLDHEANTVDEQRTRVLDALEAASDYEKEIGRLDENSKGIVKKLQEWAGDTNKAPSKKRQRRKNSLLLHDAETKTVFLGSEFEKETRAPTEKTVQPIPSPVFTKKENATLAQRIATSTLTKFVDKMDDPIARKLEGLLCSLNMQLRLEETRNLKNTHITSYFNRS